MDVREFATRFRSSDWTTEFDNKRCADAPSQLVHADCEFLARQARKDLAKGHVGRARNWVALGLFLDSPKVLAHFKRVGLFRASKFGFQGKSLLRLVENILTVRSALRLDPNSIRYLASVRSLLKLAGAALRTHHSIVRQLRKRKQGALKSLVATVDRMFLAPRPADLTLACDDPGHYTIEEHAEALSFLIHIFGTLGAINDRQFDFIDERGIETGIYGRLLVAACKLGVYREAEIMVDVFSYSASAEGNAVHLKPDDTVLEQSIRLGYIQTDSQKNLSLLRHFEQDDEPIVSLQDFSKQVYEALGTKMVRRRERPFPRYALYFPDDPEKLLKPFRGSGFFKEDAIYLEAVAREQYARPEELLGFQLADELTMLDVVKIRRFLNFLRDLMAQKLLPLMESDPMIAMRSLLPVFRKDKLLYLLEQCVSREAAEAFLRVATYQRASNRGIFDVQYQPLILGKDHYLIPMNVLCSSDLLRNLLYTQRKKVWDNDMDSPMQRLVAQALKSRFRQVAESTKLRVDGRTLEIDIVAVVERQLLLIECKSAFHPCGVHELRTSYEHVLKAGKQLDRLRGALQRKDVWRQLCRGLRWNVGPVDGILTCVVTGNRVFNGYKIGDHPVRPAYEMINMIVGGTVRIGDEEFCVWRKSHFEQQDLFDYLDGSTMHADQFGSFGGAVRSYDLDGDSLNVWTYVLDPERLEETLKSRYRSVSNNVTS